MKKLKYLFFLAAPIAITVSSCNKFKDFGDTNVNPNAVSSPIVGALLTNVQSQIGGFAAQTRGGLYAQYFSETQYTDVSLYALPQLAFNGIYAGPLMDLQDIINRNVSNNQSVAARILQQYIYWTITDRWGDVPYSEALKGNPTPKFDRQEDIYKGMIATLKTAVDQFNTSSVITGDIVYNGDVAKWRKFANSLRMLMSLQLSKRFPGPAEYAAVEFKDAMNHSAGYIATNADNFTIRYPGGNFRNAWYETYNGRKDFGESNTMTTIMSNLSDARQTVFGGASENPGSTQSSNKGMPYGLTRAKSEAFTGANADWAKILRGDYREENDPLVVIGAAHITLARAEAADRGWTTENAATLLRLGVTQSFEQWGLAAPANSYFTQTGVALTAPTGTGANIAPIALQRYIAFYPDGLQGWNIWRKTGVPALTPAVDAVNTSKQIPRRYVYGQNEYATNKAATDAAAVAIGGDTQDTRVWWDKQ
jgi:hypothetical protein